MAIRPWAIVSSDIKEDYRIFRLRVDRARSPRTMRDHDFYILESPDWVNVIPLTEDGQVVLVRQWRHGTRRVTLEIPGGLVEPGDDPEAAARRELLEETGYSARKMTLLGAVEPNPAFLNNRCHTFLAQELQKVSPQNQDEKEDIEVTTCRLSEVETLIRKGVISHSLVICAFYLLFREARGLGLI